jgi:lipoprotein-anchoring transpeptidase ErfK/SrfK
MVRGFLLVLVASTMYASAAFADPAGAEIAMAFNAGETATTPPSSVSTPQAVAPTSQTPLGIEADVEQRLRDNLSPEIVDSFGLFIYVSKAQVGPWAQHMVVFQKADDQMLPLYDWPVSTGRETIEVNALGNQMSTATPAGFYELDPKRLFVDYRSTQWNEAMPHAMFFNWKDHGALTGLAIHAATDAGIAQIGTRASAGCVRLSPQNAETLFNLIHDNYRGMVPKFGVDKYTGTMMSNGLLLHDPDGNLQLMPGYRVLVYIDEYGGESLEAKAY